MFMNLTNAKESKLTNMVITLYQPYENQNRSDVKMSLGKNKFVCKLVKQKLVFAIWSS